MRRIGRFLVFILALTHPSIAQAQEGARLRAYLQSSALQEIVARAAYSMSQTSPSAMTQKDPRRWVTRHPVLTGVLIGLGIGIALDVAICYETAACGAMTMAGIGGGALGGAIAKARPKASIGFSSGNPDIADVGRVVVALGVGERIRVTTAAGQTDGTIQTIGLDRFLVVPEAPGAPVEIPFGDVRALRKKIGIGTKVGIAIGAGFGGLLLLGSLGDE